MVLPGGPVTLSVAEIDELNRKLSTMRHDINNHLTLVVAAVELLRQDTANAPRLLGALSEQPNRISDAVKKFSHAFEHSLGIRRK